MWWSAIAENLGLVTSGRNRNWEYGYGPATQQDTKTIAIDIIDYGFTW